MNIDGSVSPRQWAGRLLVATVGAFLPIIASAGPALADPAVPTAYESRVTSIEPATSAFDIAVVGGDSFIEITVAPGHAAEIPGYFGEAYIRIDPTGTVWTNTRAPSRYINDDRFGAAPIPEFADRDATPDWQIAGDGGRYAWHDHRTHWMGETRPPGIDGDRIQRIFTWEIPLSIDGVNTLIGGTLDWHPSPGPTFPLLAAGGFSLAALAAWRQGRTRYLAVVGASGGFIGLILAWMQWLATPATARALPVAAIVLLGALAAYSAAAPISRSRPVAAAQLIVVASVVVAVFVVGTAGTFNMPLLPSVVPDTIERIALAAVAASALVCGTLAVVGMTLVAVPGREALETSDAGRIG